jgi:hypothetical protein
MGSTCKAMLLDSTRGAADIGYPTAYDEVLRRKREKAAERKRIQEEQENPEMKVKCFCDRQIIDNNFIFILFQSADSVISDQPTTIQPTG